MIDSKNVGNMIAELRKTKGLTQNELGERLSVSFQAVSKWERGETLPDTAILLDLADVLETTVDSILSGGKAAINYKGKISMSDMIRGLTCLKKMGELLGKDNLLYRSAINGINEKMNTDIDGAFTDDYIFEVFVAEVTIQNIMNGAYVDLTDVKNSFKHERLKNIVCDYAAKYGIK